MRAATALVIASVAIASVALGAMTRVDRQLPPSVRAAGEARAGAPLTEEERNRLCAEVKLTLDTLKRDSWWLQDQFSRRELADIEASQRRLGCASGWSRTWNIFHRTDKGSIDKYDLQAGDEPLATLTLTEIDGNDAAPLLRVSYGRGARLDDPESPCFWDPKDDRKPMAKTDYGYAKGQLSWNRAYIQPILERYARSSNRVRVSLDPAPLLACVIPIGSGGRLMGKFGADRTGLFGMPDWGGTISISIAGAGLSGLGRVRLHDFSFDSPIFVQAAAGNP